MNAIDDDKKIISSSDIIKLNVGGECFQASRKTLCQCPDSVLASMFGGRWEESLVVVEGYVFLDYDPDCFRKILNELRNMRLSEKTIFEIPAFQNEEERRNCVLLMGYLGLLPQPQPLPLPNISKISENRRSIEPVSFSTAFLTQIDANPLYWKVAFRRVKRSRNTSWHSIGVGITNQQDLSEHSHFNQPSSFGWGSSEKVFIGGKVYDYDWQGWQCGDEAVFKIDEQKKSFQMKHHRTGKLFQIFLTESGPWRIFIIASDTTAFHLQEATFEDCF